MPRRPRRLDPQPAADARAPEQRRVSIASTALDRLRGDPYQFDALGHHGACARSIRSMPQPTAAWRGTAVHEVLAASGTMVAAGAANCCRWPKRTLAEMSAHPFMRGLWRPRLLAALAVGRRLARRAGAAGPRAGAVGEDRRDRDQGREAPWRGPTGSTGCADGTLAVVDYKTGNAAYGAGWCRRAMRCSLALSR